MLNRRFLLIIINIVNINKKKVLIIFFLDKKRKTIRDNIVIVYGNIFVNEKKILKLMLGIRGINN